MYFLYTSHVKFLETAAISSQLLPNPYTAIPTFIFLISSFVLVYQHLHFTTTIHTRWKTRIVRDLKFHWVYFNASRLWYIFLACFKRLIAVAENYIEMNIPDEEKSFNLMVTYVAALIVVTTMAVVPVFLIYGNYRTKCDMPNFLMWALEDPYLRHKVEIARRCPDRPLRLNPKKMKNYSFRSKRFTSFDTNPWLNQKPTVICKNCKWIIKRNVVNSIEGLFN